MDVWTFVMTDVTVWRSRSARAAGESATAVPTAKAARAKLAENFMVLVVWVMVLVVGIR
jgi:t-SNARE complex subunit (syntaxin)